MPFLQCKLGLTLNPSAIYTGMFPSFKKWVHMIRYLVICDVKAVVDFQYIIVDY